MSLNFLLANKLLILVIVVFCTIDASEITCSVFETFHNSALSILNDYRDCKVYLILDNPVSDLSKNSFLKEFIKNTLPIISIPFVLAETYAEIKNLRNLMHYQYAFEKHIFCTVVFLVFPESGVHRNDYIIAPPKIRIIDHPFREFGLSSLPVTKTGVVRITLRSYLFFLTSMINLSDIEEFIVPHFTQIYLGTVQKLDITNCKLKFALTLMCLHCSHSEIVMFNMPGTGKKNVQQYLSAKFRNGICLINRKIDYFRSRSKSDRMSKTELELLYPTKIQLFLNNQNFQVNILDHLEYFAFYKERNTYCGHNYSGLESTEKTFGQDPGSMMIYGDIYEVAKISYNIVLRDHTSYNFLTCYQVSNSLSFSSYFSPFDREIWTCIVFILVMLTFVFQYTEYIEDHHHESYLWNIIKLVKPLIDQGQVHLYFNSLSKSKISFLFGLWLLLGMVLTNIYKCIVTSELVCPFRIYSPWDNYEKVANFSMLTHSRGINKASARFRGSEFYRYSGLEGNTLSENEVIHGILSNTEFRDEESFTRLLNLFTGQSELYACQNEICLSEFVKLSTNDCQSIKYVYADTEVHLNKFYQDLLIETESTIMEGKYSKGKRPFWRTYDGWTISINWNESKATRNFRGLVEAGITVFWKNWERIMFDKKPYWSSDKSLKANLNNYSSKKSNFKAQRLSSNILSVFAVFGYGTLVASFIFFIESVNVFRRLLLKYTDTVFYIHKIWK